MTAGRYAQEWIDRLGLAPHPEGGYFVETYRAAAEIPAAALPDRFTGPRSLASAIYYLLAAGQVSRLHRLRADEIWHHYDGGALVLHLFEPGTGHRTIRLGAELKAGESPQAVVPAGVWLGAEVGEGVAYALVGCTLAPGFDYADFELADRAELQAHWPDQTVIIQNLT